MMLLPCPHCGARNVSEFRYAGEAKARPDPATVTSAQWRRYLYFPANALGWVRETWYHTAGCQRYFLIERHTGTNETREVAR
jgi:heterotetrameric sarcosine oxidase delta subunit